MKKIIFVLPLLAMMVVGCSNPTNTETPEEKKTVQTPVETPQEPEIPSEPEVPETPVEPEQPQQPETPVEPEEPVVQEDKSPYEYVKLDCVNLEDYTYVGDYIFADTMNFADWKYSNATENYLLAFEKIARVKNDNPDTRIIRYNHNNPDTEVPVIKATKYKIYVKTVIVNNTNIGDNCFSNYSENINGNYDGSVFRIKKISDNTFEIKCRYENYSEVLDNYVAY